MKRPANDLLYNQIKIVCAALDTSPKHKRAFVLITEKFVVRATRPLKHDKRARHETFVLGFGAPNYRERQFVRKFKHPSPLPIGVVQMQPWPVSRKRK